MNRWQRAATVCVVLALVSILGGPLLKLVGFVFTGNLYGPMLAADGGHVSPLYLRFIGAAVIFALTAGVLALIGWGADSEGR